MSVVYQRQKKKKTKYPRNRVSRKIIHRQKLRKKILNTRGWKLNYPENFELIEDFPYIVKKKEN